MKGETQEPNKGFANTRPPAQPTQEKLSNLGLQTSAAPQKTNYKHSALDWRSEREIRSQGFSSG